MLSQKQYWASLPKEQFLNEANKKIEEFYDDLETTGLFWVIEKLYRAYYGANLTGGQKSQTIFDVAELKRGGRSGEITHLKVNHFRNLIQHTLQLATSQKAAITCRASNTDYKSQAQCILGKGLVDYYMTEKKVSRHISQAVEKGLALTEGWLHCPWNPTKGEIYEKHPDTGAPMFQGDLEFSTKTILDVPRDISLDEEASHEWLFVRCKENKYNLAAKHPTLADDILAQSGEPKYEQLESFNLQIRDHNMPETDTVTKWIFYHKKTEAMPKGRLCMFTNNVILFDGPIPYREIPLFKFSPQNLIGTTYGYTPAIEILGIQQGVDILSSTIMSNNASYGVQNIWTKRNDKITVKTLTGGMKNLQSDELPQAVQLTKTAPETFDFRQGLIGEMETIMGISATVRGNPEASLKSGNALALVVSQSIQFASLIEEGANELIEDCGTAIINQLRDFGKTPRVVSILGEASRPYQEQFTGDDLSKLNRVVVEQISPLSKTIAGRVEIANNLLQQGLIEDPKQYIMVLTTGQLDPAIEKTTHQMLLIRAENEALRKGKQVSVIVTENHALHYKEHDALLASPEAKEDPAFVKRVLDHQMEHIRQWRMADPAILMLSGQQPPPPPPMPAQMPGGLPPSGPSNQGGGQPVGGGGPPPGPGVMGNQNPMLQNLPGMPSKPKLPPGAPVEAQAAYDKMDTGEAA